MSTEKEPWKRECIQWIWRLKQHQKFTNRRVVPVEKLDITLVFCGIWRERSAKEISDFCRVPWNLSYEIFHHLTMIGYCSTRISRQLGFLSACRQQKWSWFWYWNVHRDMTEKESNFLDTVPGVRRGPPPFYTPTLILFINLSSPCEKIFHREVSIRNYYGIIFVRCAKLTKKFSLT